MCAALQIAWAKTCPMLPTLRRGFKYMTVTLELKPEEIAALESKAQADGVDVETVLRGFIEQITSKKPRTGAEIVARLQASGALGAWADREDITDSPTFARELRRKSETRDWD